MSADGRATLAILPMRGGSERVPKKNLADLAGRPLYAWILDTVLTLENVVAVVDTDDDEIEASLQATHPKVRVIRRPPHLGVGTTPMNEVLAHTLEMESFGQTVLQVHSTNPFVSADSLRVAIASVQPATGADSAFSVSRLQARIWSEVLEPVNHEPSVLLRTQDLPVLLIENSSFYVFDRAVFAQTGNRIGLHPSAVDLSPLESIDIDTAEDFEFARVVALGLQVGARS